MWAKKKIVWLTVPVILLVFLGVWVSTAPRPDIPVGMVLVPAGSFKIGAQEKFLRKRLHEQIWAGYESEYINETPETPVYLADFAIDTYPVTIKEFTKFMYATGKMDVSPIFMKLMELARKYPRLNDSPAVGIDAFEARDYAVWAGKELPSEAQWEKAARGTDGRLYPWGDDFSKSIDEQFAEVAKIRTEQFETKFLPVTHDSLLFDISPYGVRLLGNPPAEWTSSPYRGYSGNTHYDKAYGKTYNIGNREKAFYTPAYVIKKAEVDILGQDYKNPHYIKYCLLSLFRGYSTPQYQGELLGFRCVKPLKRKGLRGRLLDAWQNSRQERSLAGLYQ